MPDPLPSDIVARLKSNSTAALAAALILAGSFPDLRFVGDGGIWRQRGRKGQRRKRKQWRRQASRGQGRVLDPKPEGSMRRVRPPPSMTRRCWR